MRALLILSMLFIFAIEAVWASPGKLTYQGRILRSDGSPLEYNSVSFSFEITSPNGSCVIYRELRNGVDMTNSGGVFDVPIGSGSRQYPKLGTWIVTDFFDNTKTYNCGDSNNDDSGSTYATSSGDSRKLRVRFWDGSGWQLISPDMEIRSVPYASYASSAEKVGDIAAADIAKKSDLPSVNCTSGEVLTFTGNAFACISDNDGGLSYTPLNPSNNLSDVADTATARANLGLGTAGGDLSGSYPNPEVSRIKGVDVAFSSLASGNFLKYSGSSWINAVIGISDITGLSSALSSKLDQSQISGVCASSSTLVFSSVSGTWTCTDISISDSQVTFASKSANTFLAAPSGSAGAPTFRAIASSDLPSSITDGVWEASSGNLYRASGKVGIGTISPLTTLHVSDEGLGVAFFDNYSAGGSDNPGIVGRKASGTFANPAPVVSADKLLFLGGRGWDGTSFTSTSKASISLEASENWTSTANGASVVMRTTPNGSTTAKESFRINHDGNVGIGTSLPAAKLVVSNNEAPVSANASTTMLIVGQDDTNNILTMRSFIETSSLAFRMSRGTGAAPLPVTSQNELGNITFHGYGDTGFVSGSAAKIAGYSSEDYTDATGAGELRFYTRPSNTLASATERVRIDKDGLVGIGTKSPAATLHVYDNSTTTSAIIVPRAGNFTGTTVNGMIRYNTTSSLFEFYQNGSWVNYTTVSDGRLKTDIEPVSNGLDIVNRLNPVFYNWDKSNPRTKSFSDKHEVGFIAQEVEKVLPEVVDQGEDSYRSVQYGKIVSVVVAAMKELHSKVMALEAENAQLKEENAEIKKRLEKIEKALNLQ